MRHRELAWRVMTAFDLNAVVAIADKVHPDFYETPAVLGERRQLYPHGALLLEINEKPVGYVFSHPWRARSLPALNTLVGSIPADADTYYLHDLALLPVARRIGAATLIVSALTKHAVARGFATMSLVAVNASQGFWERHGFAVTEAPELYGKLLSYEEAARYMVKGLG